MYAMFSNVYILFYAQGRPSSMANQNLIQETEGEYRNGKAVFVKGVRMPHVFAYSTGFEEFIDKFQTRQDDVFIVGFPRSGGISQRTIRLSLSFS